MLATFIIGLREGLEASLIIGIIAAFLVKNDKSLAPMWLGVGIAVALSVAVGVGLNFIEKALPQAAQEGMESIIGLVAIFFVTGMIIWMNAHARDLKRQLEDEAAAALSQASAYALAVMAFLAVLREGFETSVFLLATFSSAQSTGLAAIGAIVGLAVAVAIGCGIYLGGVRINLGKFFRFTGAFLILVAAGLMVTSLRTAHEAGWLNAGQQRTLDLGWLVAPGTVMSALITGVLGIPSDPRVIELMGWFAYLLPVSLLVYWPQSRRLDEREAAQLKIAVAASVSLVAVALAAAYPSPQPDTPSKAPLVSAIGTPPSVIGSAHISKPSKDGAEALTLTLDDIGETTLSLQDASAADEEIHDGISTSARVLARESIPDNAQSTLGIDDVVALNGGKIPVGLNIGRNPGPFTADWSAKTVIRVWTADGVLLDAMARKTTILTLSGGGLTTARIMTVANAKPTDEWNVSADYRDQVEAALRSFASAQAERRFWAIELPIALLLGAGLLAAYGGFSLCRRKVDARRYSTDLHYI